MNRSASGRARRLRHTGGTLGVLAALGGGALAGAVGNAAGAGAASTTSTSTTTSTTTPTATTPATAVAPGTPTDSWLKRAVAAESTLGSVHVKGTIAQKKQGIVLSLLVNGDGEGSGTFTQEGSRIKLERVGPLLYFNAPTKYWASHATAAETRRYGGKWIEVSALDSRFQSFDQFLNAGDLAAAVFQGFTKPLVVTRTKLDGRKVVVVSDSSTTKGKRSSVKMTIAATGKPYVQRIVDQGPTQSTTLSFTGYGKPVPITTPPEPINLTGS